MRHTQKKEYEQAAEYVIPEGRKKFKEKLEKELSKLPPIPTNL